MASKKSTGAPAPASQTRKSKSPPPSLPSSNQQSKSSNKPKTGAWASVVKSSSTVPTTQKSPVVVPQSKKSPSPMLDSTKKSPSPSQTIVKKEYIPINNFNKQETTDFLNNRYLEITKSLTKKNYYKPYNQNNWNLSVNTKKTKESGAGIKKSLEGYDVLSELNRSY